MMSMTGFGRAVATTEGRQVAVEVRSVNHRALDVKVRGRVLDAACEAEVVRAVREAVRRGSIQVTVLEPEAQGERLSLDRVRELYRVLDALREDLDLPGPVDLATVGVFLSAVRDGARDGAEGLGWTVVRPALDQALTGLRTTRALEGTALAEDVREKLARLRSLESRLMAATADLPRRAARRLEERLASLGAVPGVDPARLAHEVAILAEKLDVSEELSRLRTHLDHLATLVEGEGSGREDVGVGRKLEFLIQELGRELNTLGTKSQDAGVSALVIDAKTELEKIREQAQNIE